MSAKPRKPTGSFVNDPSAINLIQLSPRTELFHLERSPYTMASHSSKTNFIGDSVLPEGPRAVAVSETGEKHSIHLEDENLPQTVINPFSAVPSQCSQPLSTPLPLPTVNTVSSTKISNVTSDHPRLITTKRSKGSRRHGNQKPRPVFTPRNLEKITPRFFTEEPKAKTPSYNAQTQTDANSTKSSVPLSPRFYHPPPIVPPLQLPHRYMPRESVGDMLDSSRRQPLRILPREKRPFKSFSGIPLVEVDDPQQHALLPKKTFSGTELRSIASALTLITVVSWLFSIFFELEGILDMFSSLLHILQGWYSKKEQPMTKVEMLVQYVRNLWS